MKWAVFQLSDGLIVGHSEGFAAPAMPDGFAVHELLPGEAPEGKVADGKVVPPTPVVAPMETQRADKWAAALAVRNARRDGGCATALGRVDTDETSRQLINGAVSAALVATATGATFNPISWTMADNSIVAHDMAQTIAMGVAVMAHVNTCQQAGNVIRAAIDAAASEAQLLAIDVSAGYPT